MAAVSLQSPAGRVPVRIAALARPVFGRARLLVGVAGLALLAGCAGGPKVATGTSQSPSDVAVQINPGQSMFPDQTGDPNHGTLKTLSQLQNLHATGGKESKAERAKELLFLPAMKQAALSYGVSAGLAWSTHLINGVLKQDAAQLSQTYDFTRIVTDEPGGAMILPPVISTSVNAYQQSDFGRQIRVANRTYDIVRQAEFAPNAPLWFSYLYQSWTAPSQPPDAVLPKTDAEQKAWNTYVKEGWDTGIQQGMTMFKLNLHRLNRDFVGMVRYHRLYDAGLVSAPVVKNTYLGTTGTGQTMAQGDRVEKILQEPSLAVPNPQPSPIGKPHHAGGRH